HVYTTIDGELQRTARRAVINGLLTYDDRHGWRGPERRLGQARADGKHVERWRETLVNTAVIAGLEPVAVTEVLEEGVNFLRADGSTGYLAFDHGIHRAAPYRGESRVGPRPKNVAEVLAVGDMIRITTDADGAPWLSQVPAAQAALVSLDPRDGAIRSVVGGMGFELSKFNRATQAMRQPGSSFKPFLYSAAHNSGFTAASLINDAPVVLEDRSLEDVWRPENDGGKFYGPTRLRWALTKSRNLVSIRLLQRVGIPNLIDYLEQLGFDASGFAPDLSLALGTNAMSPMQLATGYAILANGGYRVEPYLVARVEDLDGATVYEAQPLTVCTDCDEPPAEEAAIAEEFSMEEILAGIPEEEPLPAAPRVMDARVNFIVNSMLRDVIRRGTGTRALALQRGDIAGKTGTTNGPMDAWFSGYNRDVVTTTWVGFDNYTPLGRKEFGGTAALPIWIEYMAAALAESEEKEPPLPEGIVNVRIDPATGQLASTTQPDAIFEYFREEYVPQQTARSDGLPEGDAGLDDLVSDIF
ncbi:MAG: peptidase, partial [Halioglobus sp.]|nr:peptidase [Halioglobus sp.]